jgi:hypothetical protein
MTTVRLLLTITLLAVPAILLPAVATAQSAPSPEQIVAGLKQNLAESKQRLRQYEWIETTTVVFKGEEKSRKQQRVYYGADGTLTKIPIGSAPAAPAPPAPAGRRGARLKAHVVENKKEEMQDYMAAAAALIHRYVPPDATRLQAARAAGQLKIAPVREGAVRAEFRDVVQSGDVMTMDLNTKALAVEGLTVATFLDKPEDAVTLAVHFGTLADATSYADRTTLEAKAKGIVVVVENTGHRPLAP